ncbi:thioredoxin TrxC [Methylomonas sp. LL1]|uniref:thioredoxin TrxC n=1 Tax=Methylomonas sp. LL1 TaxID=2785785 RepID=UPI0018C36E19|nr:thioredoxin TrxC [Methylomonas sp. LL1]QPK62638.1 thioredoxin TrxC [Methylomonas sp. LL1]
MNDLLHLVCPSCLAINRLPANRLRQQPKCGQCHQALFNLRPLELTANNFDKHVSHNDIPLVVDFWAEWCGPCKMMAPAFAQAAEQLEPNFRLAKVNTETQQSLSARYNIRSIPTLILFKNGQELARQSGAMRALDIVDWARSWL